MKIVAYLLKIKILAFPQLLKSSYHSQVKGKSNHSSFYFWATGGSDVTLSAVLTNKKQCRHPFRRIGGFVYIRRQTIIPSSNADWSISVLFFARRIDLTIPHSTVIILQRIGEEVNEISAPPPFFDFLGVKSR